MNVIRFECGHVGRTNNSPDAKAQSFIRVAEVRKAEVVSNPKPCPVCVNTRAEENAI